MTTTSNPTQPTTKHSVDADLERILNKNCGCTKRCFEVLVPCDGDVNHRQRRIAQLESLYRSLACGPLRQRRENIYNVLLAAMNDDKINYVVMGQRVCRHAFVLLYCSNTMLDNVIIPALACLRASIKRRGTDTLKRVERCYGMTDRTESTFIPFLSLSLTLLAWKAHQSMPPYGSQPVLMKNRSMKAINMTVILQTLNHTVTDSSAGYGTNTIPKSSAGGTR